ncbi:sensor histidine kinase [Thermodesulforhabdus norvegica]|uniref:histidine kinase n=1 Tax=Thermodesulforhabdus norvegica TaxID=39841 RepID=A0A1I4SFS6_9BACT|nr:HAMP domain-containing sensor histidine kinase [Thermodesulforhabdus norvegica]SFM63143.1 Histidine kinase-, DNA gyrase B-, and HSP90-like ATPase [Thermodesulforhabdus norvegica]
MGYITLDEVMRRVEQKKQDYQRYGFKKLQEEAFATFFDLAQESTDLNHLYLISVTVPKVFFGFESSLYVVQHQNGRLEKVCTSEKGILEGSERNEIIDIRDSMYRTDRGWAFPIRGNQALSKWFPFSGKDGILGMLEVECAECGESDTFFLQKFANRIGYNLHQKLLIQQNLQHLKFINQLVADIEHNVISPNMYYRLYLRRMKKLINSYRGLQKDIRDLIIFSQEQLQKLALTKQLCEIYHELSTLNDKLEEENRALEKHYNHTSLFLESLLRRDHFVQGTYVLRKQPCNFKSEIIDPLLERYEPLFAKKGITVNRTLDNIPDKEVVLLVDKGLISQVFDNLFSNALKYAGDIEDAAGNKVKLVSYDWQVLKDYFGENIHGLKISVFTTGEPLSEEEARKVFEEGYRAERHGEVASGTGHGLSFVKNVVEIHGGVVGCEPEKYGNSFYFILPMKDERAEKQG